MENRWVSELGLDSMMLQCNFSTTYSHYVDQHCLVPYAISVNSININTVTVSGKKKKKTYIISRINSTTHSVVNGLPKKELKRELILFCM